MVRPIVPDVTVHPFEVRGAQVRLSLAVAPERLGELLEDLHHVASSSADVASFLTAACSCVHAHGGMVGELRGPSPQA